jgi:hypothetical protein
VNFKQGTSAVPIFSNSADGAITILFDPETIPPIYGTNSNHLTSTPTLGNLGL